MTSDMFIKDYSDETLNFLKKFGYSLAVITESDIKKLKSIRKDLTQNESSISLKLAYILKNPQKDLPKAQDIADIFYVQPEDHKSARLASESWGIDAIVNPELNRGKDLMNQRESGMDEVTFRNMKERNISYIITFNNLLTTRGWRLAQLTDRIRQNLMLAKKFKVNTILASGAIDKWGTRTSQDLSNIISILGYVGNPIDVLGKNTENLIKKSEDRKNPNVLTQGLEVKNWGGQKPNPTKKRGWY